MDEMMSKWFDRKDNWVSAFMAFSALQCHHRWPWQIPWKCSILDIDIPLPGQCGIVQKFLFCRLIGPFCDLVWCMTQRLCGRCGPLLQLLVIMFPIRSCTIYHWLLKHWLLWSPRQFMPDFPHLCESGISRRPCLGFLWVSQWVFVSLCLWL